MHDFKYFVTYLDSPVHARIVHSEIGAAVATNRWSNLWRTFGSKALQWRLSSWCATLSYVNSSVDVPTLSFFKKPHHGTVIDYRGRSCLCSSTRDSLVTTYLMPHLTSYLVDATNSTFISPPIGYFLSHDQKTAKLMCF